MEKVTKHTIEETLLQLIDDNRGTPIREDERKPGMTFESLEVDSVDIVEIVIQLENKLRVRIKHSEVLGSKNTIASFVDHVADELKRQERLIEEGAATPKRVQETSPQARMV